MWSVCKDFRKRVLGDREVSGDELNNGNTERNPVPKAKLPNERNGMRGWVRTARKFQQAYYNSLGDRYWDEIGTEELLEQKIGFALFGIPSDDNGTILCYNIDQNNQIKLVKKHILKLHGNINDGEGKLHFACVFVYLGLKDFSEDGVDVLFKISNNNSILFVDANCRTYCGWDDYLNKNKLPKCYMYYPVNGVYTSKNSLVNVGLRESPACKISKTILASLDVSSSVLSLGATGVSVAALAMPIAAPVVLGAAVTFAVSSVYEGTRCVSKLVDTKKHHESLSLLNPDSRQAWIGLAASTVGAVSIGGTTMRGLLAGEKAIGQAGAMTLRIVNISSIAISSVGVLNSLLTIVMNYINGSITSNDVRHFMLACLFFINAIVSYENADRLIKDVASSDTKYLFDTAKTALFAYSKSPIEFNNSSSYNALRLLVVGARSKFMPDINFNELENTLQRIIVLVNQAKSGKISWEKMILEMSELLEIVLSKFTPIVTKSIDKLHVLFKNINWKSYAIKSGYTPFKANSNPDLARQFYMSLQKTVDHCCGKVDDIEYYNDVLSIVNKFNCRYNYINEVEFLNRTKYICEYFIKEFDNTIDEYFMDEDQEICRLGSSNSIDESNSNGSTDIDDYQNIWCFKATVSHLISEDKLREMYDTYKTLMTNFMPLPSGSPCLETSLSRHYLFEATEVGEKKYWQKANEISDGDLNSNNSILFSGTNTVLIKPKDQDKSIKMVVFYNSYKTSRPIGLITVIKTDMIQ